MEKINWSEIQTLVTTLQQTDLSELIVESGDFRLVLRRGVGSVAPLPAPAPAPEPKPSPEPLPARPAVIPSHWVNVVAPMVGTFYSAPAPGEPDFVRLGERVQKGQSVCIIEAMKLMNEVEAEVSGRVVEILVKNAQPVEYGQVLLRIDPND
ncbi:MAG: acetyl-CoA carboxylase biotin carboxyl carrier protein [Thermostichales cyanobacterium BF3_bins_165]